MESDGNIRRLATQNKRKLAMRIKRQDGGKTKAELKTKEKQPRIPQFAAKKRTTMESNLSHNMAPGVTISVRHVFLSFCPRRRWLEAGEQVHMFVCHDRGWFSFWGAQRAHRNRSLPFTDQRLCLLSMWKHKRKGKSIWHSRSSASDAVPVAG